MENNYIYLISRTDFVDFFKNGAFNAISCPNIKFDGDIKALQTNTKLAETLFKKVNYIDYSIDFLLMHICKTGNGRVLKIREVKSLYALDESAFNIGLDLNPAVIFNPPIWQETYEKFQIQSNIKKAKDGVKLIAELFGMDKLSFPKMKKQDLFEAFKSAYLETEPEGNLSPWTYLLRYERHENYPKDTRGYFIDAIHIFANIAQKRSFHDSIIENSRKGKETNELSDKTFNKLATWFKEDKEFIKKVKSKTGNENFIPIAALFLTLKNCFKNGVNEEQSYSSLPLDEFIEAVKKYDIKYLKPALYFLGLTLGWDNIYQLMYKRWNLPILSKL